MKPYLDKDYMKKHMMGPNCVTLAQELTRDMQITPNMLVMDLGCGTGLTSMWLADRFGAHVFAVDLWIPAEENSARFEDMGFGGRITAVHADASKLLPFEEGFFDAVVSVDAYQYFGEDAAYIDTHITPIVRPEGEIAVAMPGLARDLCGAFPEEMAKSWKPEDIDTFHTCAWWRKLLAQAGQITDICVREMDAFEECWNDWLECDNPYAVGDRAAMNAGAGKYMNFVSFTCQRV